MLMMQGRLLSLRILDYVALYDNYFETAIAELVQLDFIFIPNSMTIANGGAPYFSTPVHLVGVELQHFLNRRFFVKLVSAGPIGAA